MLGVKLTHFIFKKNKRCSFCKEFSYFTNSDSGQWIKFLFWNLFWSKKRYADTEEWAAQIG